ncbi:MAG TPA: nucleotidyltransferase domain-containing protein [Bacteroidales bacterium]|nr:nucleotidyltransferase domain-containing protein [Bacteroidales bacterium]
MIEDNQIVEKIKVIAHQFLPDAQVLLFGSRARNDARTDSDYDILLIINETLLPKEKIQIISKIRKALVQLEIPIDVLIQSRSEIEKKKNLPGHIVRRIIKEAIIL